MLGEVALKPHTIFTNINTIRFMGSWKIRLSFYCLCSSTYLLLRYYTMILYFTASQRFVSSTGNILFFHTHSIMCFFSLFWPQKVHFKAKIDLFLNLMLLNLVAETPILYLFCPWTHTKKPLSKVGYFSFFNVSHTWYKSLLPVALELPDFQPGHHKRKWTNKNENDIEV